MSMDEIFSQQPRKKNRNKKKKSKEKMESKSEKSGDDFLSMITDLVKKLPIKLAIFIFIIFIILKSDIYINNLLAKINGAVNYTNQTTTKGEIISGIFLVLGFLCLDIIIQYGIL